MRLIILTALGVGGATVLGAVAGFLFKARSEVADRRLLAFAGGVMLEASTLGLLPSAMEAGGLMNAVTVVLGLLLGAAAIALLDQPVRALCKRWEADKGSELSRVALFVLAIAIHNIPEGLAAGVGFGIGEGGRGFMIAAAIAMQNIPEGMVIIAPMLSVGISPGRAFFYAAMTGVVEIIGTLVGYLATSVGAALPFLLSMASGTMLSVVIREMIPDSRGSLGSALLGFCVMIIIEGLVG